MSAPSLEGMTKSELIDFGENVGIEGLSDRMLKADLIQKIEEGLNE